MAAVRKRHALGSVAILGLLAVVLLAAVYFVWSKATGPRQISTTPSPAETTPASANAPELSIQKLASGFVHPWDIAFLPSGALLISERAGTITQYQSGQARAVHSVADVYARGEAGLMGLMVDVDYEQNKFIFACYASTSQDVRLVRWKYDGASFSEKTDIVTGIPLNPSGRHSGCRPRMDAQGTIWLGTGDAADGQNPQAPGSLGGKILRIDRYGKALEGNQPAPFDSRIYSYGHRNVQGIALYPQPLNGLAGISVEHGSNRDDEINPLLAGNAGWNPVPGYNERVAMTDTERYPEAIRPLWTSGDPTIAPSGASFLSGDQWQAWDGALAVAVLKGRELRLQRYDSQQRRQSDDSLFKNQFGRLRSAVQGPDGSLYLVTDNGNDDSVIRVTPK